MKTLCISMTALLALASIARADTLPETQVNVIGNVSTTTQSALLERPFWTQKIQELSGDKVKAQFRTRNEMGLQGPETFGLLSDGVMDITNAALGHRSGADPIADGNDLAGMTANFDDFEALSNAFRPVLSDYFKEKLGIRVIGLLSYQGQVLYCRTDFTKLSDVSGLRVRTSGASQADFISYLGGQPIDMAFGEVQQALEQGVIDCAITGTLSGYTSRWYEGAKTIFGMPINFGAQAYAANDEWWESQDEAVRTFLTKEIDALVDEMWALNRKEDREGLLCNATGPCSLGEVGGLKLVEPTEADLALRQEAFEKGVLPKWFDRCGDVCKTIYAETLAPAIGLKAD